MNQKNIDSPKPYANKGDLTTGDINHHLFKLTLPMIWGILAIISFQLADTFYISKLGVCPLAAISFTFPVTYAVHTLLIGMSIATSSVVSRQIGAGNQTRIKRLTTHALIIAFGLGVLIAVLGAALNDKIFSLMNAPDHLMPLIRDYMIIWFAGSIFIAVPMAGNAAMRAGGDSLSPALLMTFIAVLNIIINPFLIFGWAGLPAMGMKGAAITTIFSNSLAMVISITLLYRYKHMCFLGMRHHLRLLSDSFKRLIYIALPVGITNTIQPIRSAFITGLLAAEGTEAVAAYGIVTRIEAMAFVVIMALATGMAPIIGQNWGAKYFDRVQTTIRKAICFAVLWTAFVAVMLIIFARPLTYIFSDQEAIVTVAVLYFWLMPTSAVFGNLVPGWSSSFNAMGKPRRSLEMIVVKNIILTLPLIYIGAHYYGVIGIFGALALVNTISGIGYHLLNRRCLGKIIVDVKNG